MPRCLRLSTTARSRRGFTLFELMIASSISAVAMIALIAINVMINRFTFEATREARIMGDSSLQIREIERTLNEAYRLDSETISNAFSIQNSNQTIEFSVDNAAGTGVDRERYRFDSSTSTIKHDRKNSAGAWVQVENQPVLSNVVNFGVDNQEGIITMMVRLRVNIPRYTNRQFTLLGRALPRNI